MLTHAALLTSAPNTQSSPMLVICHCMLDVLAGCTATQTLAYQSGMFSRAQALRRDGCAPAAMGVPDDLPTRMAYQQLNILAGMAGKVSSSTGSNLTVALRSMQQA